MNKLSVELIELISSFCVQSKDQATLCQVNKLFYRTILPNLYKNITIKNPRNYDILKNTLNNVSGVRKYVRRLDFSSYTTKGSRLSEEKSRMLIKSEEFEMLVQQCFNLRELLVGEEMKHFITTNMVKSIFNLKHLKTIDFLNFSDKNFTTILTELFYENQYQLTTNKLKNVSFYMCSTLSQNEFFVPFFKDLSGIEKLDLGYTRINSDLFDYLPNTITHLNLQGCHGIHCCSPLISFLLNCKSLVELNLNTNTKFCYECLYKIMTKPSLKSLNLNDQLYFNDLLIQHIQKPLLNLEYLSIANCKEIKNFQKLLSIFPNLFYLNTSCINLSVLDNTRVQVIEINKRQHSIGNWKFYQYGKRFYLARNQVDPKFCYSKKLILLDNQSISPMNAYWSYLN